MHVEGIRRILKLCLVCGCNEDGTVHANDGAYSRQSHLVHAAWHAERKREGEAELELQLKGLRQEIENISSSMYDAMAQQLDAHNTKQAASADLVTILSCTKTWSQTCLVYTFRREWESFGYTVAHLASRSTGGEAGVQTTTVLCVPHVASHCMILC
jgi:hypothetical protein